MNHDFHKNVTNLGLYSVLTELGDLRLLSTELTDDTDVISSADGHCVYLAAGQKFISRKYCPELCDS